MNSVSLLLAAASSSGPESTKVFLNPKITIAPVVRGRYSVRVDFTIVLRRGILPFEFADMSGAVTEGFTLEAADARAWASAAVDRLLVYLPDEPLSDEQTMLYLALPHLPWRLVRLVLKEVCRQRRKLTQKRRLGERRWDRTRYDKFDRYRVWTDLYLANRRTRNGLDTLWHITRNLNRYSRSTYFPDHVEEMSIDGGGKAGAMPKLTSNPTALPTFKTREPIPGDPRMSPFFDGSFMGGGSFALRAVIKAVEEAGHALTGLYAYPGHENAVFTLSQGSGKLSIGSNPHDFTVRVHHPAMGDWYDVHLCETTEQILTVLNLVEQ